MKNINNITIKKGLGTVPVYFTAATTILGAILFLRFGTAVGTLGFFGAFFLVILGHLITIPTALAISEIATNTRVEGGGLILDKKVVTGQTVLEGNDGKSVNYLNVTGDAEAQQIFEHLANNSTEYKTEYGLTKIGSNSGDEGKNMIGVNTEHTVGSTAANRVVLENGYTIREAIHNHPSGNNKSSEGDIKVAERIQGKFPNATLSNYTAKHGYTQYNKNTEPYILTFSIKELVFTFKK